MSVEIRLIVEGATEQAFADQVLGPHLALRGLYLHASLIGSPGKKGGNVRFERVAPQIKAALKQRSDTLVGTFFDYYGLKRWPGLDTVRALQNPAPKTIAETLNEAAVSEIERALPDISVRNRFLPFTAVHEFEALLFADSAKLAAGTGVPTARIEEALARCGGSPEAIDNGPETAPSKRLEAWTRNQYGKITTGIPIAEKIGIDAMRSACPNFDDWIQYLEAAARAIDRSSPTEGHSSDSGIGT